MPSSYINTRDNSNQTHSLFKLEKDVLESLKRLIGEWKYTFKNDALL